MRFVRWVFLQPISGYCFAYKETLLMHLIDDSHNVSLQMCPPTGLVSSPMANTLFTLKGVFKNIFKYFNFFLKNTR